MKVTYSVADINELFAELSQQTGAIIESDKYEEIIKFPSIVCDGWIKRVNLRPGIELVIQSVNFSEKIVWEAEYNDSAFGFGLSFCLSGKARGTLQGCAEDINFSSGRTFLGFAVNHKGYMEYSQQERARFINVVISPKAFHDLIQGQIEYLSPQLQRIIYGRDTSFFIQTSIMTSAMKMASQQIFNCPYQGLTKRLYLESKAIELVACYIDEFSKDSSQSLPSAVLKTDDIERVYHAKEILLKNYLNPPSLIQLSRLVGLNDYKLKLGFRYCFNNTVFGYLKDYRMQQAQLLLAENNLNITEVARAVGYNSETSFSAAFKKQFGVAPIIYKSSAR